MGQNHGKRRLLFASTFGFSYGNCCVIEWAEKTGLSIGSYYMNTLYKMSEKLQLGITSLGTLKELSFLSVRKNPSLVNRTKNWRRQYVSKYIRCMKKKDRGSRYKAAPDLHESLVVTFWEDYWLIWCELDIMEKVRDHRDRRIDEDWQRTSKKMATGKDRVRRRGLEKENRSRGSGSGKSALHTYVLLPPSILSLLRSLSFSHSLYPHLLFGSVVNDWLT